MENTNVAKKSFSRIGFALLAMAAVSLGMQVGVMAILNLVAGKNWMETPILYVATFVPVYVIGIPVGLLIMKDVPKERIEEKDMSFGKWLMFFSICIFAMYIGSVLGLVVSTVFKGGAQVENPLQSYVSGNIVMQIIFLVILAPLIEEFVFRKVLIERMRPYGEKLAVVISALCFGLFHQNFMQFFYAFFLGLIWGYIYIRTGKLRYSAALHMTINFLGSIVAGRLTSGLDLEALQNLDPQNMNAVLEMYKNPAFIGLLIYLFIIGIIWIVGLVMFCINFGKRFYYHVSAEVPKGEVFKTAILNPGLLLFIIFAIGMCFAALFMG
ncbi:MAG: CPBP family intramembrane metalloprotease [Lachnospiraceae bacterium]|nr:CPBP family intramembrane metalloprotease [Lachnospiraceae bacterium]